MNPSNQAKIDRLNTLFALPPVQWAAVEDEATDLIEALEAQLATLKTQLTTLNRQFIAAQHASEHWHLSQNALPPVAAVIPTRRLRLPPQSDNGTDVTAQSPADAADDEAMAQALAAIEALEAQLKRQAELPREILARPATERPDWNDLVTALDQARCLVPAESPLAFSLEGANKRLHLLRDDTRALLTALTSSLADWFSDKAAVEQVTTLLTKFEQCFGPDRAPVPVLRAASKQRMDEVRAVEAQLASLETLEGAALERQLKELADLRIPESLVPLTVKRRLNDYQAALAAEQQADRIRKAHDIRILLHREKRRELDNLYEDADLDPDNFITLRKDASVFSAHPLLTPAENPLDPQTFAYYDLLFASRHRALTTPTEQAQMSQTMHGKGEYLQAYQILLREARQFEYGDDEIAFKVALKLRDQALANLQRHLEDTTRDALALAQKSLNLFEFQAAEQTLVTQRKYIKDTSIELDQGLLDAFTQADGAAKQFADRDGVARELIERAEQLTRSDNLHPDYRTALEKLDKAAMTAEWLKALIERQTMQVRQRQAAFVTAQIQLAEGRISGGTPTTLVEAEALLSNAELHTDAENQQQQIVLLRIRIDRRRQVLALLEALRTTAKSLAEAARTGTDLDLLPEQILDARVSIGSADAPKFEPDDWFAINQFLVTAETRLVTQRFNGLAAKAEQAALRGQEATLEELLAEITALSNEPPFLKLTTTEALRKQARRVKQLEGYASLQGEAASSFRNGWDKPDALITFMRRLRAFAEQLQPEDRQAVPALAAAIILELDRLAETVAGARVDYDNERFSAALRRVKSALSMIPATSTDGTLLDAYASTLSHLRETLTSIRDELEREQTNSENDRILLDGSIDEYNKTVSDLWQAFNKATLMAVRNKFTLSVKSRESKVECDRYTAILKRITDLIDTADALEDLIISGHRPGEETPAKQSGAARLALVEQQISVVLTESEQICATIEGVAWYGIKGYERFKALHTHRHLAHTLAEAQLWLEQTRNLPQSISDLRRLRDGDVNELYRKLKLRRGETEDDLKRTDCLVLLDRYQTCIQKIATQITKISLEIAISRDRFAFWHR